MAWLILVAGVAAVVAWGFVKKKWFSDGERRRSESTFQKNTKKERGDPQGFLADLEQKGSSSDEK